MADSLRAGNLVTISAKDGETIARGPPLPGAGKQQERAGILVQLFGDEGDQGGGHEDDQDGLAEQGGPGTH